jgi:tetratricopeptide (TPR) repeat protein
MPPTDTRKTLAMNPGLIVFHPRTSDVAAADLLDFGAGCGLYLSLMAAGHGQFGQTPLLTTVYRAREELKLPDQRLNAKDAGRVAALTGATHIAVGTLTEKNGEATLSYRVYTKDGAPVGDAITRTGTRDDLTVQLPIVAAAIGSRLGLVPPAPTPLVPCGFEMTRLGGCERAKALTAEQAAFLAEFAQKNHAAALLHLTIGMARQDRRGFERLVSSLVNALPENPLVLGHIGYVHASALIPHRAAVERAAAKYPKSYALAHTEVWLARVRGGDPAVERQAAARAVQNAPRNPDAYLALGWTIAETAHRVRKGKMYGDLTPTEQTFVARVYPEWLRAVRRAAELDPKYAKAWLRVAEAATFQGSRDEAVKAWDAAAKNGLTPYDLYVWGLQMFQEKWGGDPARLRKAGEDAAKAEYATVAEAAEIARGLQEAGLTDLHARMTADLVQRAEERTRAEPNSAQAHYDLAQAYKAAGQTQKAIDEFEIVAALRPKDADARYDLGAALAEKGMQREAVNALREAVRLAPEHERAYCMMAWTLKHMNQLPEAEEAAKKAVALNPDYAQGWCVLGTIYATAKKDDECIAAYQKALALWPHFPEAYHNLFVVYSRRKDWDNGLKVLQDLVTYRQDDPAPFVNMAHCYQMKKDWKRSEEASRYALMRDENNAYAYANLGVALLHQGKTAEGKQSCEKAISLSPDPQLAREVEAEMTKLLKKPKG